ncbi:SH3 domain-containing protein [Longimicrobium sp.]|uniref:SH3 domain-containing protein n=1 Tax=Longimicrobium sp. TaxID=2029185 RepID=UPI003B3A48DE
MIPQAVPSLDSLIRAVTRSPRRLAITALCLLLLAAAGARVVRGGSTQTVEVLGPLNVRSGPGREHPVVTHAGKGARLRIAKPDARGWAAVRSGSRTIGYVRALPEYVRVEDDADGGGGWWLLAALAAASGAWILMTRGRNAPASIPPVDDAWADRTLTAPRPAPAPTPVYAPTPVAQLTAWADQGAHTIAGGDEETESERNGRNFEEWAAVRLGRSPFHLKEWRGDKYVAGVFAESTLAPDLLVEYRDGRERAQFAVECKWRSRYYGSDELRWGEQKHLRRYQRYADEHGIPVYLLIGVGGSGADPLDVYLVPLEEVPSDRLYFRELKDKDRVDRDGVFRYDVHRRRLRLLPVGG